MNKKNTKFNYGWIVLILICFGLAMANYSQYQVSGFGAQLTAEMNLTATQFSTIATGPLIPGIFLSLVSGMLVDKFGARRVLTISVLITCVGTVLRIFTASFLPMYLCMICIGVCASFLNANAPKILGQWFSPTSMSLSMSIFLAAANIGIMLGQGTSSLYNGLKGAFIGSAVIAVIVLVLWFVLMRERPEEEEQKGEKVSLVEGLKVVVKSKTVWLAAVCLFLAAGSMTSLSNFLPQALQVRGFSESSSTVVAMALTFGSMVGCFISPYIYKYFKSQKVYFIVYAVVGALGYAFAWRLSSNAVITFILLFITGISCNGFTPMITAMPVQDKHIGTRYGGTAGGFVATVQLGGSVLVPTYVIAPLCQTADGINFQLMFSLFAAMLIIFIGCAMFLPNKKEAN